MKNKALILCACTYSFSLQSATVILILEKSDPTISTVQMNLQWRTPGGAIQWIHHGVVELRKDPKKTHAKPQIVLRDIDDEAINQGIYITKIQTNLRNFRFEASSLEEGIRLLYPKGAYEAKFNICAADNCNGKKIPWFKITYS